MNTGDIAKKLFWTILTFFAFLEYFSGVRPFIQEGHGIYVLGFFDGGIAVAVCLVVVFYIASLSDKGPIEKTKSTPRRVSKKVKPSFVKEIIRRCEIVQSVVEAVHQQLGDYFIVGTVRIDQTQDAVFKEQMEWLAENYPKIAGELSRATRMSYVDPIRGVAVDDYDPLLQTIRFASLKSVFANSFAPKEFKQNLEGGISRLRAYLGLISE